MLFSFDPKEKLVSLPWFLTQQLSHASYRFSRLEVESCWLFGGLLLSQIMANNSTNGRVGLLLKMLNICWTSASSPKIKHVYIYDCLGSNMGHRKWICWCGSMFSFWWISSSNCVKVMTLLTMKVFVLLLMKVMPSLVLQIWPL